jgi:hypothetical protein
MSGSTNRQRSIRSWAAAATVEHRRLPITFWNLAVALTRYVRDLRGTVFISRPRSRSWPDSRPLRHVAPGADNPGLLHRSGELCVRDRSVMLTKRKPPSGSDFRADGRSPGGPFEKVLTEAEEGATGYGFRSPSGRKAGRAACRGRHRSRRQLLEAGRRIPAATHAPGAGRGERFLIERVPAVAVTRQYRQAV